MKLKFEVHIEGTVPDCLTIEARDQESAIDKAITEVMERLTFTAKLEEEPGGSNCDQVKPR
jgi:hypothetical protein